MVLRIVLQGGDRRERIGALKVVQAFCMANPEGQQALTTTIGTATPPPKAHLQTGQSDTSMLIHNTACHADHKQMHLLGMWYDLSVRQCCESPASPATDQT